MNSLHFVILIVMAIPLLLYLSQYSSKRLVRLCATGIGVAVLLAPSFWSGRMETIKDAEGGTTSMVDGAATGSCHA